MGDASTGTFDMQSWQGLTKVLQAGRDANMDSETYAEFRDSVLRYAQSGGTDATLRVRIEELLPGFEDMAPKTEEKPAPQPEEKEGVQKHVAPPGNLPMAEEESVEPAPKKEEAPEPPPVVEEEKKPEPKTSPQPAPVGELMSTEEAKERIAEIKHAVTEYVGNPVTLVSENETVGRAYMQALLSAMKSVSGTAPGTLRQSMQALEGAYKQVLEIKVGQPKAQPIVQKEKKSEPPQPAPSPKVEEKPAPPPIPEKKPEPVVEQEHTISSLDERIRAAKEKNIERVKEPPPVVKEEKKSEPPQKAPLKVETPKPQKKIFTAEEVEGDIEETLKKTEPKKPFVTPDIEGADATTVPKGVTDDLYTPEIEEGMDQLLRDWSIFRGEKKIFGRGPGGKEHPLFQRLKNMIMFDVIAGHFEGAQKDVVLSIRDYANAWRNEQGIVYSPSESFDHYLRRVIRRIIKRST
ncbi:hypothetical protein KTR10_03190 [Candidatus Kaiserbacteria bacterium]|nr:hypothetical protein [Candidatus Kaiserbacteria bacterium]